MASGNQHYAKAEKMLDDAEALASGSNPVKVKNGLTLDQMIELAKAHAWLANAAAMAQSASGDLLQDSTAAKAWRETTKAV